MASKGEKQGLIRLLNCGSFPAMAPGLKLSTVEDSMIHRTFCLLLILVWVGACAETIPPVQEELSSKTMPAFDGRFSSFQNPISLEYRPVAMKLAAQLAVHTNVRDKDELFTGEVSGLLKVSPAGESLLWEFKVDQAVLGEEKISSVQTPLMEFRARRDKLGATKEVDIAPVGMKVSTPEEKRLFQEVRSLLGPQFRSFSASLPASPVQEGNLILETDMNAVLLTYEKLWGSPRCSPAKEKIGYWVRGLGSVKGRKVIVAVMEEDFTCAARNERRYNFGLHGYALVDTETGQILEHKTMTTVKSFYSFDSIEVRTLQKVSAEVIE